MTTDDRSTSAQHLNLTRFRTDSDVHLGGLVLGAPAGHEQASNAATGDRRSAPRRIVTRLGASWQRFRRDVFGQAAAPDRAVPGSLVARHAEIGGELRLPRTAIGSADLAFLTADKLDISGSAFRTPSGAEPDDGVALRLANSRLDSVELRAPLPHRVDLQNSAARHWEILGEARSADDTVAPDAYNRYLELLDRSSPFARDAYAGLEQDFRTVGQHHIADKILTRMGWRSWRLANLRGAWETGTARVLTAVLGVGVLVGLFGLIAGWLRLAAVLVVVGVTVAGFFLHAPRRAAQFWFGLVVLWPFQVLYGFGVRWWLPLALSALTLGTITLPMMSDCRNLIVPGADRTTVAELATGRSIGDRLGRAGPIGPVWYGRCTLAYQRDGSRATVPWTLADAFWLSLRYHLPIVPLDAFFDGERAEDARPSPDVLIIWDRSGNLAPASADGAEASGVVERLFGTAGTYARTVYLLSWLVVPFSLIFAAGRIQRKYRLQ
ncbi:MAG: hypothetical protein ACYC2K_14785 [Gemmatimonadales bacterium]